MYTVSPVKSIIFHDGTYFNVPSQLLKFSSLFQCDLNTEILSYTKFTYISVLIGCHCNELCLWEEVSL